MNEDPRASPLVDEVQIPLLVELEAADARVVHPLHTVSVLAEEPAAITGHYLDDLVGDLQTAWPAVLNRLRL